VSVGDRCASPSPGLPAKTFTPPAAPPRSRDRQSRVTRTVIYREISSQPFVFSSSTTTSRHRLSTFSTLASIPAFPERTITIPVRHARGCWRTEQSECLLVFLLSLPLPSPLPFSLSLCKRRRISGPFNPGFLTAEDSGGTEGQRVTDTALRRQHSRIMQFSDVLIWQRSCKRLRTHTRLRLPSTRRSCRTTDAPRFLPGLTRNSAVRSSLPSRMEGHSAAGM